MKRNNSQLQAGFTFAGTTRLVVICVVAFSFAMFVPEGQAVTGNSQIQSKNLRVEFDPYLRTRVIARFGARETPLGPVVPSESVKTSTRRWTLFRLVSQTSDRVKNKIGEGQRLTVTGKIGNLTKVVAVTI